MHRHDDPRISGDMVLLRRIPPDGDRTIWDDVSREPIPSSMNFSDPKQELSVHIRDETTAEKVLAGHDGFGLVYFTAEDVRTACGPGVILCRCEEEPENGHVLICGKITGGARKKIQKAAKWFEGRWPARRPSDPLTEQSGH